MPVVRAGDQAHPLDWRARALPDLRHGAPGASGAARRGEAGAEAAADPRSDQVRSMTMQRKFELFMACALLSLALVAVVMLLAAR